MEPTTYFIFNLDQHDIDPNFIEFLAHQGIKMLFQDDGRRGAIVSLDASIKPVGEISEIPQVSLSDGEMMPDLDPYLEQGKQTTAANQRKVLHSGSDNYGRGCPLPPKCKNPECMQAHRKRVERWAQGIWLE